MYHSCRGKCVVISIQWRWASKSPYMGGRAWPECGARLTVALRSRPNKTAKTKLVLVGLAGKSGEACISRSHAVMCRLLFGRGRVGHAGSVPPTHPASPGRLERQRGPGVHAPRGWTRPESTGQSRVHPDTPRGAPRPQRAARAPGAGGRLAVRRDGDGAPVQRAARSRCARRGPRHSRLNLGLRAVDVNHTDMQGWTAMHYLAFFRSSTSSSCELVGVLVRHGASVNQREAVGASPLYLAAQEGASVHVVATLLALGAHVDLPRFNGWTPLHVASTPRSGSCCTTTSAGGASRRSWSRRGVARPGRRRRSTPRSCAGCLCCSRVRRD